MSAPAKYMALAFIGLSLSACGWIEVPYEAQSYGRNTQPSEQRDQAKATSQIAPKGAVIAQKGDTVYAIARRNDKSVRAIIERNKLQAPFHLKVGQIIYLPQGPEHVVQKGDTLYSVSHQYHTDVYTLAKTNSLKPPFTLTPGQRLRLPSTSNLTTASKNLVISPRIQAQPLAKPTTIAKTAPKINKQAIPKPPPRSSSRFAWPLNGKVISRYGTKQKGLRNDGINIAAKRGTAVKAAEHGVVAYSGNELRGFGNMVLVKHSGGWITAYAHTEKLLVKRGQKVKKGQTIASVGSSGGVTTPQLHFEIRKGMNAVDPKRFLGG